MKRRWLFTMLLSLVLVMLSVGVVFAANETVDVDGVASLFESATAYSVVVIGAMGILAFLVSVFVEVTKSLPFFAKIPTDLQVIITSLILCEFMLYWYVAWQNITVQWYYIGLALFMSLAVSFVAMFGWDKIYALYTRYSKFKA